MDTTYLRTFQRVVETSSFSAAAQDLGYAQSTVTGHIKLLERSMGRQLIERRPSGAALTDAGVTLLRHTEVLLRQEQEMLREVEGLARNARLLRLAAPESLSAYRFPSMLATLARSDGGVNVSVTVTGTAAALAALRRGAVDAAVVLEPVFSAADMTVTRLGEEPVHLLRGQPSVATDQLAYLLLEHGCSYSDDLANQLSAGRAPASRIVRMGSVEVVKRCCIAGMGIAALPAVVVKDELARGELQIVDDLVVRPVSAYLVRPPAARDAPFGSALHAALATLWPDSSPLRRVR